MFVLRPIRNTPIQSVGRAYNFFEVKLVTHVLVTHVLSTGM